MKVGVVGVGYVGLVAGTCFSDVGNHVLCMDQNADRIAKLKRGEVPIYEPGLSELIERNVKAKRLHFTTSLADVVKNSEIIFLAVGTPSNSDGSADLRAVLAVAESIAKLMTNKKIIVMKSTVPVGTHAKVTEAMQAHTKQAFDYVSNPEFLKEGAAIDDFLKPDRVVIGSASAEALAVMKQLYSPFMRRGERIYVMDAASAEMAKYAANAMLATRITFMNEVSGLCEAYGADVEKVRAAVGSDERIGPAFLFPGVGYGGSCFPKDVRALIDMGRQKERVMRIVEAVDAANQQQQERFARRVIDYYGAGCEGTVLAVWGLAFKAKTDDVRESAAIRGIEMFQGAGMKVRAHDPEAMETGKAALGGKLVTVEDGYEALDGADGLVIFTDWQEFRTPDFDVIKQKLKRPVIFDGRNLYDPGYVARQGIEYYCIGRPYVKPQQS